VTVSRLVMTHKVFDKIMRLHCWDSATSCTLSL